jgi:hypothetical protein
VYSNILVVAPDGQPLSRVSNKRARWYLDRNLAKKTNDTTLQLLFEPKGRTLIHESLLEEKENICVVCGTEEQLTKHHIILRQFRVHMSLEFKSKSSFDVALVCELCHTNYHRQADLFIKELYKAKEIDCSAKHKINRIVKLMESLKYYEEVIPQTKVNNLYSQIQNHTGVSYSRNELSDGIEILKVQMENLPSPAELLLKTWDIEKFIVMWRKHFVNTMDPQFLSDSWLKDIEKVSPLVLGK